MLSCANEVRCYERRAERANRVPCGSAGNGQWRRGSAARRWRPFPKVGSPRVNLGEPLNRPAANGNVLSEVGDAAFDQSLGEVGQSTPRPKTSSVQTLKLERIFGP